jgi:preprotein translocase subunit SecD
MSKLLQLVAAIGLVAAPAACKSDSRSKADKAADRVADQNKRDIKESPDYQPNVAKEQANDAEFTVRRDMRMQILKIQHDIVQSQPQVISTLASSLALTEPGAADVNDKVRVLEMRLDDANNAIQRLGSTPAEDFKKVDDDATKAMDRLEDARKDAWKALKDAPRTNPKA